MNTCMKLAGGVLAAMSCICLVGGLAILNVG